MTPHTPSFSQISTFIGAIVGLSVLACSTGPSTTGPPPKPKVGLVAQGESFSNLTAITENMDNCDESDTSVDGKVVFSCYRENNWDLFLKSSPTGGAVQKLTSHGAQDINPSISPKGDRIAFTSNRSGNYDIFVMSLNGGTAKQQVTDNQATEYEPDWSPDGTMLAYTRLDPIDGEYYIWIKNLENNANIQLGPGISPKFSPDGEKILFQKQSKQGNKWFGLWTMNMNGAQQTQIVSSDEWGAIDANWSPDGEKFIFVSSKGTSGKFLNEVGSDRIASQASNNLWVVNQDGSAMTQLTTHPKNDIQPSWSAQNHIYFTSWRDGKKRIWRFTPILPDNYVPNTSEPISETPPEAPATNDIMEDPDQPVAEDTM
jgi:TolB protein